METRFSKCSFTSASSGLSSTFVGLRRSMCAEINKTGEISTVFLFTDKTCFLSVHMGESAKQGILSWARGITASYANIKLDNILKSWEDGLAFCAIVHHYLPPEKKHLIPYDQLRTDSKEEKLKNIKVWNLYKSRLCNH